MASIQSVKKKIFVPVKRAIYAKKRFVILIVILAAITVSDNFFYHAIGAGGLGLKSWAGQIGTMLLMARHRCDVSSELRSPGAKPRRWAPPLVTRFGVIPRV